jgi:hypothetical protein
MSVIENTQQIGRFSSPAGRELRSNMVICLSIFLVCLLVLAPAASDAAPILLVEFTHKVSAVEGGEPLPATVPFDFDAYEPFPLVYFSFRGEYGANDVGMTYIAPPEVVIGANQAFASPSATYLLETGPANFSSSRHLSPSSCQTHECLVVFVDDVTDYLVTSVERAIDQLTLTRTQGNLYILDGAQRVRFWGERIPEPNALALLVASIGCCSRIRIAGRRPHRFA